MSTLIKVNEDLAVKHMQKVVCAAINYQRTPIERLKTDAARTARVEAKVLRDLANQSNDSTLKWAADEAEAVIRVIFEQQKLGENCNGYWLNGHFIMNGVK